ncbi:MAG: ParB/RepB/Spo0J family partition protein [Planctomycetota bacterium]|jgi:ParB family chromosome partitioning protein
MQEKKLGRGLDFLLNLSTDEISKEKKVENIELGKIRRNRFQPREIMDEDALNDLKLSIKENGVLQPILLRKEGLQYEIIAGERRYQACLSLGEKTIPAIILNVPENKLLQLALIENIQRENLNPIEEAKAYQTMSKLENFTHEDMATRVGKKRSTITNALRLLELPEEVQGNVSRGTLSAGHARALLGFKTKEEILLALRKTLKENLTVREVENLTKTDLKKLKQKKTKLKQIDPNLKDLENQLMESFGTKIEIKDRGDKGVITFFYYSKEDFKRLYDFLLK